MLSWLQLRVLNASTASEIDAAFTQVPADVLLVSADLLLLSGGTDCCRAAEHAVPAYMHATSRALSGA